MELGGELQGVLRLKQNRGVTAAHMLKICPARSTFPCRPPLHRSQADWLKLTRSRGHVLLSRDWRRHQRFDEGTAPI